jgi:hypothetical protein
MDNSHVSLVSVSLRADGFDKFRWEDYGYQVSGLIGVWVYF